MNRRLGLIAVLLLLCLTGVGVVVLPGCESGGSEYRQAIVICLDAARPDRFSCYGYERLTTPRMDELATRGMLCLNNFSQATATRRFLPTFLYSRYFASPVFPNSSLIPMTEVEDLFRCPDDEMISLSRAASQAGLLTAAISSHLWIKAGTIFEGEFEELHELPRLLEVEGSYPTAAQVVDYTIDWLEEHLEQDYLLYLHLMDTHFPHYLGDEARDYWGEAPVPADRFHVHGRPLDVKNRLAGEERRYLDALYDGDLKYTDAEIGRLVDYLQARERLDETLIVITADHGELLLEVEKRFEHGGPWYDLLGRTPLIVSYPSKLEPRRIDAMTEGVDIHPTVLSLLQIDLPAGKQCDGCDLTRMPSTLPANEDFAFFGRGVRGKRYKCIFFNSPKDLLADPQPELDSVSGLCYDTQADPLEETNLWGDRSEMVETMYDLYRTKMYDKYQRFANAVTSVQPRSAFAVASNDFQFNLEVPRLGKTIQGRECADFTSETGWVRYQHANRYLLMALPGAGPLVVQFAIPDGVYHLSTRIMGDCSVRVRGANKPVELRGQEFRANGYMTTDTVDIGTIAVTDQLFEATITPYTDQGCFLMRTFGFSPVLADGENEEMDQESIERLRALGYVD